MKATMVDDIEKGAGMEAGAIEFREYGGTLHGIAFRCPCGCGRQSWLPLNTAGQHPFWTFNGDRGAPTLTPSVYQKGMCGWHGFLTAGEWRSV